jgi:hypothetical protein
MLDILSTGPDAFDGVGTLLALLDLYPTQITGDPDWSEIMMEGDWWRVISGPYFELVGRALTIGIPSAFYMLALLWRTESLAPPAVLIILFGGIFVFQVPPLFAVTAGAVATIALAYAYMAVFGE